MRPFDTRRWAGVAAVALVATGVGVLAEQPAAVLAGVVGIAYAAAARVGEAPAPSVDVRRTLSDPTPEPDDEVEVTVVVENAGETLYDLRLVDGVPPGLEVIGGSPRHATALGDGDSTSFSYTVRAARGAHEWGPVRAITRNLSGSWERESRKDVATVLRCTPSLDAGTELPLRGLTSRISGRVGTDLGGPGVEFHSERSYRHGDPAKRIDWKRLARTGDLATMEFRQERAASVVLLVDAREEAYLAPEPGSEHAVERGVDAAGRALTALLSGGDRVGVAALSPTECWLSPGTGRAHRRRAMELLADSPALAPTPPGDGFYVRPAYRRLRKRLPDHAQVILFSPACDDGLARLARRFDAYGHPVTLVSPDPTATGSAGATLATIERRNRLSRLRGAGIRVIDWGDEPLATAIAGARRGWRR
ncbi:MAG: DUF58 domain-containing protein [Haloferacaceae archaeon]